MSISATNHNPITELFKNLSYLDQYGSKVMLVSVLLLVLFVAFSYVKNMQKIRPIRDNWTARRCDADVMPMAGFINKPEGQTILGFTNENFQYCVSNILKPISQNAVAPFDYLMEGLLQIYKKIMSSILAIRALVAYMRSKMAIITNNIYNRLVSIVVPIQEVIMRARDLMSKVVGVMEVGLHTALSTFVILKAFLAYVASASANVLIIGSMVIASLGVAIAACFFYCQPALPYLISLLATYTTTYIVIMVLLIILIVFIRKTTGNSTRVTMFDAPKCFDENTIIVLKNGTRTAIKHIELGDVLEDGGKVTAKMKLTSINERMYQVGDVIVSGSHSVEYQDKWVCVRHHPDAKKIQIYTKPYLYCLNTTTKVIPINGMKFIDWDEVYINKKKDLEKMYEERFGVAPPADSLEFIHQYFDGGIKKNTSIIKHGAMPSQPIQRIEIGDILEKNIEVYGIVHVDAIDIQNMDNVVGGTLLESTSKNLESVSKHPVSVLYHLLTSSGHFYLNNQRINDYNNYIDVI